MTDPKECQELCKKDPACFYFAVNLRNQPLENNGCWLKKEIRTSPNPRVGVIFGPKECKGGCLFFLAYSYSIISNNKQHQILKICKYLKSMYDVIINEGMHPKTTQNEAKNDEGRVQEKDVSGNDNANSNPNKKVCLKIFSRNAA